MRLEMLLLLLLEHECVNRIFHWKDADLLIGCKKPMNRLRHGPTPNGQLPLPRFLPRL